MTCSMGCPECGHIFRVDPNAGTVRCPKCREEIDVNEYRRERKADDFPKARGN